MGVDSRGWTTEGPSTAVHLAGRGFSLDEISVPLTVWQGRQDAMVPYAHGEWLAGNVRGARGRLLEEERHLSLVLRFGEVVDDLLAARS